MTRYVVQQGPGDYALVDAPSPRAAALHMAGRTKGVFVWYRARRSFGCWTDADHARTRYLGKVDPRVEALLASDEGVEMDVGLHVSHREGHAPAELDDDRDEHQEGGS